jgi:hypothetical protein
MNAITRGILGFFGITIAVNLWLAQAVQSKSQNDKIIIIALAAVTILVALKLAGYKRK